jgi:site-specific DNA-adenine methylase
MYKNPFNYTGAKFKLLPQILPLFPDKINTFVDLFGGSGELTFNTQAEHYIYNEKSKQLVHMKEIIFVSGLKVMKENC